jgi:3-phosphoshikimate 1-carboxyvinyltransferase
VTDFLALPPVSEIRGELRVPPSKSATNRALLAAALGGSTVVVEGPLESDDTEALRACLVAMGAAIRRIPEGLEVQGPLRGNPSAEVVLDARESGTAARFLAAAAAATPGRFLLTGSARLRERPIGELVDALRTAGASLAYRGAEGCLPLAVDGGRWRSGEIAVDASRSSQFLSALLLAGLAVDGGVSVRASGTVASAPYVRMTVETLRALGHDVEEGATDGTVRVRRGARAAERYAVPGDYSSAVPLLAAVGAAGGRLVLKGLHWPSGDADAAALPVLERMGLRVSATPAFVSTQGDPANLRPVDVAATDFPDAVPPLAALAALARGESRFTGIGHLRLKESDRIAALAALLGAAGAHAVAEEDALVVTGPLRPPGTPRLPTANDHRMAMAAAILAIAQPGLLIENPDCVAKSYPGFFRDLEAVSVRR